MNEDLELYEKSMFQEEIDSMENQVNVDLKNIRNLIK